MDTKEFLSAFSEKFGDNILNIDHKNDRRVLIFIEKDKIADVAYYLFNELKFRFIIASGSDVDEGIDIVYHFAFDRIGLVLNIRVLMDREKPEVESVTPIIKGAEWIEREMFELLGINFLNHPNLKEFVTEGYDTDQKYPLRRNYNGGDK